MTREEYVIRDNGILFDLDNGLAVTEVAKKYGMTSDAVRQVCIKEGVYDNLRRNKQHARDSQIKQIKELRSIGENYAVIASKIGMSVSFVRNVCVDLGITARDKRAEVYKKCRELRLAGYQCKKIAEICGIGLSTAESMCHGLPAPQRDYAELKDTRKRQHDASVADWTSFFESCGYTNVQIDGRYITGECCSCGSRERFYMSNSNRRKGMRFKCKACEKEKRRIEKEASKKAEQEQRKWKKKQHETFKQLTRVLAEMEREAKREAKKHECPVCGKETYKKKYCSSECAKTAGNKTKETRRRIKIEKALVDQDITLKRLYKRDGGKCQICGGDCDYSDHTYREGAFIVGENYPSIDHIVPLSKGGSHSWDNVQLAHWLCNTRKGASMEKV